VTSADAYARLFGAAQAGVFSGTLFPSDSSRQSRKAATSDLTLVANPYLKQIFGYPADASAGDVRPFEATHFYEPEARQTFLDRLGAQRRVTDYLLRMRRLDGSPLWIEVTGVAEDGGSAGALKLDALVRDVSERKRVDDKSRDIYQQLIQAERMAALGQTISGVAHELNNPLATILSWAERLSERPLDDAARKGVDVILSEAERAARIVRNLLTFARKRQSTRAMVDINQIVMETLSLRAYEQRVTNIGVETALAADLPAVFADAHQIQQVLLNLVINAEHAMLGARGHGALHVSTSHDVEHEMVAITVRDSGPGVPSPIRGRIFDPFFTTKEVGKGTGLGLTVAYAIVQEHGGRIQLDSPAEGGAIFRVELPVSGARAAKKKPLASGPSMEAVRGASVLVVEDELALAAAVAEALTDAGLKVTHAGDGEQALALLERARYDVIVCDLKMPRVDGVGMYKTLRAKEATASTPVIFMTGDILAEEAQHFLEESGCRWLAKPFRLADLLRVVKDTLA
jgi:signal transduction histidine kinase/BarA-like signal transduction histidine kinase